jgi:hypothetical protein
MHTVGAKVPTRSKPKLTSIRRTGERLGLSPYGVLKLISSGHLEVERVDERVVVTTDSLDKYVADVGASRNYPGLSSGAPIFFPRTF